MIHGFVSDCCADVSMFGSVGTGVSADWGDDVVVGLFDKLLSNGGNIIVWLLWSALILWNIGCNDKFCSGWLVSITSDLVSMSG